MPEQLPNPGEPFCRDHKVSHIYLTDQCGGLRAVVARLRAFWRSPNGIILLRGVRASDAGLRRHKRCLDRRIATPEQLVSEIAAWERRRNASGARIKWMVTTTKARAKMGRAYPEPIGAKSPSPKES
jgi:hypothetical protein